MIRSLSCLVIVFEKEKRKKKKNPCQKEYTGGEREYLKKNLDFFLGQLSHLERKRKKKKKKIESWKCKKVLNMLLSVCTNIEGCVCGNSHLPNTFVPNKQNKICSPPPSFASGGVAE